MMRQFVGLILLFSLISVGQSDEFHLKFSTDIIDAATLEENSLEGLGVAQPAVKATEALPVATPIPTAQPASVESDHRNDGELQNKGAGFAPFLSPSEKAQQEQFNNDSMSVQTLTPGSVFIRNPWVKKPGSDAYHPFDAERQSAVSGIPFDQLQNELRTLVGEDVYAQMVWTYLDAKRVDNWIYTTVGQLDLFSNQALFVGLNDQIRAGFTSARMDGRRDDFGGWQNSLESLQRSDAKSMLEDAALQANFEEQSRFFAYLKYLTPMNLIYLMLIIMALIYGGKLFKFLISQR
jgi:hypothetical protein